MLRRKESLTAGQNLELMKILRGYLNPISKNTIFPTWRYAEIFRFMPYKPRIVLVKGNIETTVPNFVKENPGLRISLLRFDCDLYRPTKIALKVLWPLVVPKSVVIFDEYGIRPWEGESFDLNLAPL